MGEDSTGGLSGGENFVSKKTISIIYFGGLVFAWLIIWALNEFDPELNAFIGMYPVGCTVLLGEALELVGYVLYPVIYICAYIFRRKEAFIALLTIYITILCLNVLGCEMMLRTPNV